MMDGKFDHAPDYHADREGAGKTAERVTFVGLSDPETDYEGGTFKYSNVGGH